MPKGFDKDPGRYKACIITDTPAGNVAVITKV